jgi:ATP-dependent Clp protease ATP-binding subunit ClpA
MFERFTQHARATVVTAQTEAQALRHGHIGTEHLLLGLLAAEGSAARRVLTAAGLTADGVRADVQRLLGEPRPLLSDEEAEALRTVGIDVDAVLARIEETFGPGALDAHERATSRSVFGRRRRSRFTGRAKKVLELSLREAVHLGDKHIGTEHILLGLVREGAGLAAKILTDSGVDLPTLRRAVLAELGKAA